MGAGMARRLLDGGFKLTVFNRTAERAEAFGRSGAEVAATPAEAAASADIVISMVAEDAASRSVWTGDSGALSGARPGTVLIESSTISLPWLKELAGLAAERGCELLDAPVTGSKTQAEAGQLIFLVGGSSETVLQVRPILASIGSGVIYVGPSGCGALLKLINNFLCGVEAAGLAEAMAWIERSSLDRQQAMDVLTNGAPGSPLVRILALRMQARDYEPNFELQWMAKDLRYAIEEAARSKFNLAMGSAARDLFQGAQQSGWAESDLSAVVEPLRPPREP
jgi:3-hydroxyisobutyrate dehydrogenase